MSNSTVLMRRGRSRKWRLLNRNVLLIVVATIMAWGLFLGLRINRESSTAYDRDMANCITYQNQKSPHPVAGDAATIATDCARNTLNSNKHVRTVPGGSSVPSVVTTNKL
jgi:hypothetical protein